MVGDRIDKHWLLMTERRENNRDKREMEQRRWMNTYLP